MSSISKNAQSQANKYVTEYLRCKQDFHHFCNNYIYFELPGKDVLFTPYQKQTELIDL